MCYWFDSNIFSHSKELGAELRKELIKGGIFYTLKEPQMFIEQRRQHTRRRSGIRRHGLDGLPRRTQHAALQVAFPAERRLPRIIAAYSASASRSTSIIRRRRAIIRLMSLGQESWLIALDRTSRVIRRLEAMI